MHPNRFPVYRGCGESILGVGSQASGYHGQDGLGDIPDPDPPSKDLVQKQHAVFALIDLVEKYKGTVMLLGDALNKLIESMSLVRVESYFCWNIEFRSFVIQVK